MTLPNFVIANSICDQRSSKLRNCEIVIGCFNKRHADRIRFKTENIVIRDWVIGDAMRDKTSVAVKIESACKEH
jgi:hypothetical protein